MSFPPHESDINGIAQETDDAFAASPVTLRAQTKKAAATDFQTLNAELSDTRGRVRHRTLSDWLIEVLTPVMIFLMLYSVLTFLVDVRGTYMRIDHRDWLVQMEHDWLRRVVFFFIMGVVALNRLIARDGKEESVLYVLSLAIVVGLFTISGSASFSPTGAVVGRFPFLATLSNMGVTVFIWWIVNRLTHECCVDENPEAGEIGLITSTARRIQNVTRDRSRILDAFKKRKEEPMLYSLEYEAVDPTELRKPKPKQQPSDEKASKLPRRHPGTLVLYASVPSLIVFVLGQRVLMNAGPDAVRTGNYYVITYTVAALSLLMLSSLGGLREYFRTRDTEIPTGLAPFWMGLGFLMVAAVIVISGGLPLPELPPFALIPGTEAETVSSSIGFTDVSPAFRYLQTAASIFVALLAGFALLRGLGVMALTAGLRAKDRSKRLARFLLALDRHLERLARWPSLPNIRRSHKFKRKGSACFKYSNPLSDSVRSAHMTPADIVAYSYSALCALADDIGVPRHAGQTPYEFIEAFPQPLQTLREEAFELTQLYVVSTYSNTTTDEAVFDRLRTFWRTFEQVRRAVSR